MDFYLWLSLTHINNGSASTVKAIVRDTDRIIHGLNIRAFSAEHQTDALISYEPKLSGIFLCYFQNLHKEKLFLWALFWDTEQKEIYFFLSQKCFHIKIFPFGFLCVKLRIGRILIHTQKRRMKNETIFERVRIRVHHCLTKPKVQVRRVNTAVNGPP